jgi:hypothetical protein
MTWSVRFHLNVGYLLHGVSWKTCKRKFQMSRTRNSKFMDIFLSKIRIGNFTPLVSRGTLNLNIDEFQSWKLVHLKSFGSRTCMANQFIHIFLLCLLHLLFPAAVHFNPCLIFRSSHCRWDLRGTNFHALIQSGRMSIANLRFRASRSIWRTTTKKRKPNDSSGSRMLSCIVSRKLTEVTELLFFSFWQGTYSFHYWTGPADSLSTITRTEFGKSTSQTWTTSWKTCIRQNQKSKELPV